MKNKADKSSELVDKAISLVKKDITINKKLSGIDFSYFLGVIINLIGAEIFKVVIEIQGRRYTNDIEFQITDNKRIRDFFAIISLKILEAIQSTCLQGQDYYTLFTNMFLHAGWMHLIGNMVFLWIFADNIEATIGNIKFLLFYLGGGIAASVIHVLLNSHSNIPSIGASGAISAVMGTYLIMFPTSRVKVLVLYFFRSFYISALVFLGIWIAMQLFNGFSSLGADQNTGGVAHWAHIGGFAFGLLYGLYAKRYFEKKGKLVQGKGGGFSDMFGGGRRRR